ncbi:class I SAM-dependent methyltransferase [Paenibacillus sp. SEL3]|uniref:Class I SAM-dependent methyltransferase n=1 Tax=Paenibacillus polymyxa TaxID=1406 RepID=A0A8I1INJ7_PAEPO|nr:MULTISPECIES: class I SAM-dependent methyltransferase [Paenibacillus]KAF6576915.1 class I SAM-dependent methyltransferase [Paenibacillus sp. EKM206P]KAF6590898.1 class I SAM-dependent methyltransferase [Paenibacillus sp. EKM205P]MBM0631618.1 class I SAM-dependent methyltransferase [Paenibacillus polymyxa]MBO3283997.1 class I SAM-dependent methyltransferase [Paenibacillus polymyxa]MBP1310951.1 SAM-dependent methyltransferase [Paenibacillus sp. 1182]
MNMSDPYLSRFFVYSDPNSSSMIYRLPQSWWSRPYEYEWCLQFMSGQDSVLDAACGIPHPFKFELARRCAQVYACDLDIRIVSVDAILAEVRRDIGEEAAERIQEILPVRLHSAHANLTALPYEDASFDKIVCISVLEHLTPEESLAALHEFHRTIRDDGMLLLTFDYPTVDLSAMEQWIEQAGFSYWNGVDLNLPRGALHTDMWGGLHCFRTVLKKYKS